MSKDLSDADNRNKLEDESFALPDEQKKVRAAVEERYPSLKNSDKD